MRALLNGLVLELISDDIPVQDGWQTVLDLEIKAAAALPESKKPDIQLAAAVLSHLPEPPKKRPSYSERTAGDQQRAVRYYETKNGGFLDLARPAQINYDFKQSQAQIRLAQQVLDAGNLEDISLIALAPFLRRRGIFITHAFAAAKESAVLLCGPPGSGKTTTGLALLNNGWRYLANDAALLREDDNGVSATLSPGAINLHPHTLAMFANYAERAAQLSNTTTAGKQIIARDALLRDGEVGQETTVATILFPRLTGQSKNSLHEVSPAIGLARLIEENVDQWDTETYEAHIDLLTHLSRQVRFYDLHLPRDRFPLGDPFDNLTK